MKKQLKIAILILSASLSASAKTSPSFDCHKASTDVEKAICASDNVSFSDAALGKEFKRAKEAVAGNAKLSADLKTSQIDWASNRKFCIVFAAHGESELCLEKFYDQRIAFLKGITTKSTSVAGGDIQPMNCAFFGSWETHWDKSSPEDAKKLYTYIAADADSCWKQLASKNEARGYYARNYIQLVLEAGADCKEASQRFDEFALAQEKMWSLSTDYLQKRLDCHLGGDAQLTEKIKKLAEADKTTAEEIYQKLKASLAKSPQWTDIDEAHKKLEMAFKNGTPLQQLIEADMQKHYWADTLKIAQAVPHQCGGSDACVKLQVGAPKKLTTVQVHFNPSNDTQADITAIEFVDEAGKAHALPLPDYADVSLIEEKWAVSSENCDGDGIHYLAIGHSTAKFPFWNKFIVDTKNSKLVQQKDDCASETQD